MKLYKECYATPKSPRAISEPFQRKKKAMKIFLIIYLVLYLLLEVAFRNRLLETIGIVSDTSSIENIEILGRLISSLGFAILVASLVKVKKASASLSVITFIMVYFLSFSVFFGAQKYMVDSIVASVPNEVKERAFYLQLYKENVFYGKMNPKNFPYTMENKDTSQSKVFLANLPLLNVDNNRYVDYLMKNSSPLINNAVDYSVDDFSDAILADWFNATGELNSYYDDFKYAQKSINKKIKSIDKDSEKGFEMLSYYKEKEFRAYRNDILRVFATDGSINNSSLLRGIASNLKSRKDNFTTGYDLLKYDENGTLFIKKDVVSRVVFHDNGVSERYFLQRSSINFEKNKIETEKELTDFMAALDSAMVRQIHKGLLFKLEKIDKELGYNYSDEVLSSIEKLSKNLCKTYQYSNRVKDKGFKNHINESSVVVMSDDFELRRLEVNREVLNNNLFNGKRILVCSYENQASKFKLILKDIADKYNKVKYGFNRDYTKPLDFFKTKYFRTKLQKELKYKKMEVPLNFNSKSYAQFKKYYKKSVYKKAATTLTHMVAKISNMDYKNYIKEYGYVRLNINEKQLFELPAIKKSLNESVPFLFDKNGKFVHRYRTNKYNDGSYVDKLPTIKDNFAREQKKLLTEFATNPVAKADVLDNYAKSLVVPPFVLLISTIMIIVNLVSLFWRFVSIKNSKIKIAANVLFFTFIALFPLIFSNAYVETKYYERLVKHGTPESYVLTTVWLQNTNVLFEKSYTVGKVFEPLIDLFEHNVLLHDTNDGYSEVRKRMLREKLKS